MNKRKMLILFFMALIFCALPLFADSGNFDHEENYLIIIVDVLASGLLVGASIIAWQIYSTYREGEMAVPWGLLAGGVIFFMLSRLLQIAQAGGLFLMPNWLETFIYLFVSLFLLLGFFLIKRAIS